MPSVRAVNGPSRIAMLLLLLPPGCGQSIRTNTFTIVWVRQTDSTVFCQQTNAHIIDYNVAYYICIKRCLRLRLLVLLHHDEFYEYFNVIRNNKNSLCSPVNLFLLIGNTNWKSERVRGQMRGQFWWRLSCDLLTIQWVIKLHLHIDFLLLFHRLSKSSFDTFLVEWLLPN